MTTRPPGNPAVPIWFLIHHAAVWWGGVLWARQSHGWAVAAGIFGVWSLVWAIGLMSGPGGDQREGLQ